MNAVVCRALPWDSEFFGRRIGRVVPTRLTPDEMARALAWADQEQIDCLYLLADFSDRDTIRLVENNGFRLMDLRTLLDRTLKDEIPPAAPEIRPWQPDDLPVLRKVARGSYRDSRFYFDERFPDAQCDTLYETWIEKSCHGYAEQVLVAEYQGAAAGYISCHIRDGVGDIGLVGVDERAQGRGLGRSLVMGSLAWFKSQGLDRVTVVTQGRNIPAQRLYQRCGFMTRSVELWYHRWFTTQEDDLRR
ncbi:MAG TPA: GNAT family N-acetyltransferase [Aggregatilinea sp.]|jgi:dTDP-4-amino-4,6-dideoxy-D-galactose acyltransferase|uniref:GNAT family N-acetyltransferase n=1 Tax=Aggregatilinea sp. TaxID=2806333 RepID=UPI002C382A10|nr:GNAT family N-acetyltransferase [Aggregatilinea sp.]HML22657.1 GNAT family N-acetyltransferase [Aggregatilinea sp.]